MFGAVAVVLLQIADPQHQLGDGGGADVQLDAQELVRVDGLEADALGLAEFGQSLQHLALQPLHQLQRDIEEVAGAAGGVHHAGGAELMMEGADGGDGLLICTLALRAA